MAASIYRKISGKDLYQATESRKRGTREMVRSILDARPEATPKPLADPTVGHAPPTEDDLRNLVRPGAGGGVTYPDAGLYTYDHDEGIATTSVQPASGPTIREEEQLPVGKDLGPSEIARVMSRNANLIGRK